MHCSFHEIWSLHTCSWHGVGNDPTYNRESVFETFPFPEGLTPNIPAADYADDPRVQAIAKAAKRLDELRNAWLNPPDLVKIEPEVVPGYPDRILPKDAEAAMKLKERTLTKLYNGRPQWLDDAHRDLDAAVAAAYGWPADISEEDVLARLLTLNLERSTASSTGPAPPQPTDAASDASSPLPAPPPQGGREGAARPLVTREAFEKISAVEGMKLSEEAKRAFAAFDEKKLTPEERRRAIVARFKREAAE